MRRLLTLSSTNWFLAALATPKNSALRERVITMSETKTITVRKDLVYNVEFN